MEPKDIVWTEKYRPKKIEEIVGDFKESILNYLKNPQSMQHLLFYSVTGGTGKTTLAKAIVNYLNADCLFLNTSDDRKIETMREKVKGFVKTKSSKQGIRRIVFMDEADGLTMDAQKSLKSMMETYADNALFILTCNTISKIDDRLVNRCKAIKFKTPNKLEIYNYLENICKSEGLEYTKAGLNKLININYPSIRACVVELQDLYISGKKVVEDIAGSSNDEFQKLWHIVSVQKDWTTIKNYIFNNNNINIRELNKFFWFKSVEESKIKLIQVTASNEDKFSRGGDEDIIFISSLVDMVR